MKRSDINALIRRAVAFAEEENFRLPPFAFWTPEEWRERGPEADEIRDCMLGWDVTDFGADFKKMGLVLFTIRNGHPTDPRYPKSYCEKMMIQEDRQFTPMHFHWNKAEDIINRAGGDLVIELYNADDEGKLADTDVELSVDGVRRTVKAGGTVRLKPGESICLTQRVYHKFWAENGRALLGEVSRVNDDQRDNRFLEPLGRFPSIEEDEPPQFLLCSEYPPSG
jgi:hypothetical protein